MYHFLSADNNRFSSRFITIVTELRWPKTVFAQGFSRALLLMQFNACANLVPRGRDPFGQKTGIATSGQEVLYSRTSRHSAHAQSQV